MDSYLSHKILIADEEIDLGDSKASQKQKSVSFLQGKKYMDKDDSYRFEGGSDDDEESEDDIDPNEFEEQLKQEKSTLFWRLLKDFFIGFLVSAAMFTIFYGVVSVPPKETAIESQ